MDTTFWLALLGIVWVDLLLSGDNALVIAMVCRNLPPSQQRYGIIGGAAAAIGLRVILSFFASWLMGVPLLSLAGGLFLLYVAINLLRDADDGDGPNKVTTTLGAAIWTIAVTDISMSVDNVMALAALSHGNIALMAFGVLLSIPLVIAGSVVISTIIGMFPILTWAGAALLGWVAGGIISDDPYVRAYLPYSKDALHYVLSFSAMLFTLGSGWALRPTQQVSGTA